MLRPVYVDGIAQLYDVYLIDGTWLGSKRTFEQAYEMLHTE